MFFERFKGVFFIAGILFFAIPFVFMVMLPTRQLASKKPPSGKLVSAYSPVEQKGRQIYIREGCMYCHSQFVRPVDFEVARYGKASQSWEHLNDLPHLYGTRRIGPDLARESQKRTDDWHYAHLYGPSNVVKDSVMPSFSWLFEGGAAKPNEEGKALVAYLQTLGRNNMEEKRESAVTETGQIVITPELTARGKTLYETNCGACHGEKGDGKGPAAAALTPKPRNFIEEKFKYGDDMQSIFKTLAKGSPGTAMPSFAQLPSDDRKALAAYVRSFREAK